MNLSVSDSAYIVKKIANALACIHEKGFVHLDIKPANIMIRPNGTPALMDFGAAQPYSMVDKKKWKERRRQATCQYVNPEIFSDDCEFPHPSWDTYQLGVLAFRLFSGKLPFTAADPMDIIEMHRHAAPPLEWLAQENVHPELISLVGRMLRKKASERPQNGAAVEHELTLFLKNIKNFDLDHFLSPDFQRLQKFKSMVSAKGVSEEKYQLEILRLEDALFPGHELRRHFKLPRNLTPDFIVVDKKYSYFDIIEVKRPSYQIFKKDGEFCELFKKAIAQIHSYLKSAKKYENQLEDDELNVGEDIMGYLIVGRSLKKEEMQKIDSLRRDYPNIRIVSYDLLVKRLEDHVEKKKKRMIDDLKRHFNRME